MKLVVLSDTHINAKNDAQPFRWWHRNLVPEAAEICRAAVQDINRLKPDVVVHCGDITDPGDGQSMELAREVFGKLNCPFHFVPGNHDCWERGARARTNQIFGLEGGDTLHRAIELEEAVVLLVDGAYWESFEEECKDYLDREDLTRATENSRFTGPGGGLCIPDRQIAWIGDVLMRTRTKPVLVFLHAGLNGRRAYDTSKDQNGKLLEQKPLQMDFRYRSSERLLELFRATENVKAVFSGHLHWNECSVEDGLLHCTTGTPIQYPCEMRLVELSDRALWGRMIPLSDATFPRRSFVKDADGDFIAGRPEDREFRFVW